jgi:hypothetical protein
MRTQQSNVLRSIKTFADNEPTIAERNAVYAAALLPLPEPPSSLPAPSAPMSVSADPNANGTATVRWKASGNSGAVYTVWRKLAGNSSSRRSGWWPGSRSSTPPSPPAPPCASARCRPSATRR